MAALQRCIQPQLYNSSQEVVANLLCHFFPKSTLAEVDLIALEGEVDRVYRLLCTWCLAATGGNSTSSLPASSNAELQSALMGAWQRRVGDVPTCGPLGGLGMKDEKAPTTEDAGYLFALTAGVLFGERAWPEAGAAFFRVRQSGVSRWPRSLHLTLNLRSTPDAKVLFLSPPDVHPPFFNSFSLPTGLALPHSVPIHRYPTHVPSPIMPLLYTCTHDQAFLHAPPSLCLARGLHVCHRKGQADVFPPQQLQKWGLEGTYLFWVCLPLDRAAEGRAGGGIGGKVEANGEAGTATPALRKCKFVASEAPALVAAMRHCQSVFFVPPYVCAFLPCNLTV